MAGLRVLIVDDNVDVCVLIALKLESAGIDVVQSFDGVSGLANAQSGKFDAAILDIDLPRISGLEVLTTLRQAGNQLPVLMLTGTTSESSRAASFEAGANDYVTKPFSPRDLLAKVHALTTPA